MRDRSVDFLLHKPCLSCALRVWCRYSLTGLVQHTNGFGSYPKSGTLDPEDLGVGGKVLQVLLHLLHLD